MSSLAMPTAVVASVPTAAIAQSGHSAGSPASDANGVASGGESTNGGVFAALLGRQMAGATTPAEAAGAAVIAAADKQEIASADPFVQPVDLSVLLQGLLLPMSAGPAVAQGRERLSDDMQAGRPGLGALPDGASAEVSILELSNPTVGPSVAVDDSPGFAEILADEATRAAADAAIADSTAETAAGELPLQVSQSDVQPSAQMMSHRLPDAGRVERESLVVPTPVTSPNWHEDIGSKVMMLIGKEASSAELVLTPPHLGRVEVQLTVNGDQTSATFVAATPAAREALEQALPRLREFLADAGINLTQASVGGDAQTGQGNADGNRGSRSGQGGTLGGMEETTPPAASMRRIDALVDTFA